MPINIRHLEIYYGIIGARDKFEEMANHLIGSEIDGIQKVRVHRGDSGIDAYGGTIGEHDKIDIYQVKYFANGIDDSEPVWEDYFDATLYLNGG
ncbi:hypothetical protein [Fimbriiglobus ruber]|uniref:hypothetical protein n=1 Tax=Fimbriiglobus ruber TaxID=1908690 RepID=UPI00117B5212|nr:hypothetical protein [Fimbriiglobus ruber]